MGGNGPLTEVGAPIAASLSPLVAFAAAIELLAIGAYISPLLGIAALAVWVRYGTYLPARVAPVLAIMLGGLTTWTAFQ